ncbi:ATP-binding protein [Streptomyces sp. F63]|uniref:ATP-binding protein n=1 Tax=Streptomyces sp. F63 TaxID=2824887 RepID=UPI001B3988D8|nr:ATP-binding protein [Streptomyces sp. F63]MBQ0984036.1 ATP-binding protein [Streptomyces sp. F63]
MDPNHRGPDEHGHHDDPPGARHHADGTPALPELRERDAALLVPIKGARSELVAGSAPAPVRTTTLVAGEYLLTVNPLDGSEVEACPPAARPAAPALRTQAERARRERTAPPPVPAHPAVPATSAAPLLERAEERIRLRGLLARGRSVRVTGPSGSGRTALLDAVAEECADLAPHGVVRLSGHRRTSCDLLYDLFGTVYDAPGHRPGREELLGHVRRVGAVVVLDDLEFGGSALGELLDATPECAFLFSATPDVAAPPADTHVEEVHLSGLSRGACTELLQHVVDRPLTDDEAAWAGDLWFESEGLPLRFVQAGALLRQRDALRADPDAFAGQDAPGDTGPANAPRTAAPEDRPPAVDTLSGPEGTEAVAGTPVLLPTLAEAAAPAALLASRLSESARETLRLALALSGDCPHHAHLPALTGDSHADAALGELLACGLVTPAGGHHRLAAGVATQLESAGYGEGAADRAHLAGRHYAWWAGHPSVVPERAAAEAEAVLAVMAVLVSGEEPGHPSTAVRLARTVAPVLAAALNWSAWERALRHGQEAARISGEVAEEAYFHHELGVLALCTGKLDRARAELEASIALRGVLADRRGAVAGRRALALVEDKAGGFDHAAGGAIPGEGLPAHAGQAEEPTTPPTAVTTAFGAFAGGRADTGATAVTPAPVGVATGMSAAAGTGSATAAGPGPGRGKPTGRGTGRMPAVLQGARRNIAAVSAGALLTAVLGTVVTLGATSGGEEGPPDRVISEQSANEDEGGGGLPAEAPVKDSTRSPRPVESGRAGPDPSAPESPAPSASGESGSTGSGSPSASRSTGSGGSSGGSGGSSGGSGTTTPTKKPSPTPSTEESTPEEPPEESPEESPASPGPSTSGGTTNTAGEPAPVSPVGSGTASASQSASASTPPSADGSGSGEELPVI